MRKCICGLLVLTLLCSLFSCSSLETVREIGDSVGGTSKTVAVPTIDEQVCFSYDGLTVTAKEIVNDSIWGQQIKFLIENNSDKDYEVHCDNMIINDYMFSPWFYETVSAGKKANEEMSISSTTLEEAGITNIGKIELDFHVTVSGEWDRAYTADRVTIQTSLYDVMDSGDPSTEQLLYDNQNIRIYARSVRENGIFVSKLLLRMENNSGKDITVSCEDFSVNGFMIDAFLYCELLNGKKAVDDIIISNDDLEENSIESIDNIELKFEIIDSATYHTIDESNVISINLGE